MNSPFPQCSKFSSFEMSWIKEVGQQLTASGWMYSVHVKENKLDTFNQFVK